MIFTKLFKNLILVLILLASMIGIASCSDETEDTPKTSNVNVWYPVNTVKVLQDDDPINDFSKLTFTTFKGDVESAQLIFTPEKDVASFNFTMNDVKNSSGDKITADKFEVFVQKYIEVVIPSSKNSFTGVYPDALIPMRNYTLKRENRVKAHNNQGIWVNLNVPTGCKEGVYEGTGTLTIDDQTITIPVSVKVYNITMPTEIHSVTSSYIEQAQLSKGEIGSKIDESLIQLYYDFLVSKRSNARNVPRYLAPGYKVVAKDFASYIVDYAKNPMVSSYALPYRGYNDSEKQPGVIDYEYCYEVIYELAAKNAELLASGDNVNLFKKAHFYLGTLIDEPTQNTYQKVRDCDLNIQKAKLAVASTGVLDAYPEVKESLITLKHVVTAKIDSVLYGTDEVGGIQTWCPLVSNFTSAGERELAKQRQNSTDRTGGESVWWYNCINPKSPYVSYQIDERLLPVRLKAWMEYEYDIEGSLYWSVNQWERFDGKIRKNVPSDPWVDPISWEDANGDGRLVYPGYRYGVKGPISTIRLETIRESNEDYELLWLFEQTINEINKANHQSFNSDRILAKFYNQIIEDVFAKNGVTEQDFDQVRIELLDLLELMVTKPSSSISQLNNLNK